MPPTDSEFQRDMTRMQTLFDQVKHQYDLYFSGARRDPPSQERAELDRLVSKYSNSGLNKLAQQFMFSTFAGKYTIHAEQWNKWLRAREEGLVRDPRLPASVQKARKALQDLEKGKVEEVPKPVPPPARAPKAPPEERAARQLFDRFINAKLESGEVPQWDFEAFRQHIEKQKASILKKYGGQDVLFTVQKGGGKVTLKAKIVK